MYLIFWKVTYSLSSSLLKLVIASSKSMDIHRLAKMCLATEFFIFTSQTKVNYSEGIWWQRTWLQWKMLCKAKKSSEWMNQTTANSLRHAEHAWNHYFWYFPNKSKHFKRIIDAKLVAAFSNRAREVLNEFLSLHQPEWLVSDLFTSDVQSLLKRIALVIEATLCIRTILLLKVHCAPYTLVCKCERSTELHSMLIQRPSLANTNNMCLCVCVCVSIKER